MRIPISATHGDDDALSRYEQAFRPIGMPTNPVAAAPIAEHSHESKPLPDSHNLITSDATLQQYERAFQPSRLPIIAAPRPLAPHEEREPALTVQEEGFLTVFGECMRAQCYVCHALADEKVDRKRDEVDKASEMLKNLQPLLTQKCNSSWEALGLVTVNLISTYIANIRDEKKKVQAGRVVDAFMDGEYIKAKLLDEIGRSFVSRYKDQINQLTTTRSEDGSYIFRKSDGIVVLARRISTRIALHIMRDGDAYKHVGKESKQQVPTQKRCLMATYNCTDDGLPDEKLHRRPELERSNIWSVVYLLQNTGLKLIKYPNVLYTCNAPLDRGRRLFGVREVTSLHETYGFCYIDEPDEINDRGFAVDHNARDPFCHRQEESQISKTIPTKTEAKASQSALVQAGQFRQPSVTTPLLADGEKSKCCVPCIIL